MKVRIAQSDDGTRYALTDTLLPLLTVKAGLHVQCNISLASGPDRKQPQAAVRA